MIRFALFIFLVAFAGWLLENVIGPWTQSKILEARLRREYEQQNALRRIIEGEWEEVKPQPIQCICQWFDHDTLLIDPRCQAIDHGNLSLLLDSVRKSIRVRAPYRFKNRQD